MKPLFALGAVFLAFSPGISLHAQEAAPFACVVSNASPDAVAYLADDALPDGEPTEERPDALDSIVDTIAACIDAEAIPEELQDRYIESAILTLMETELRKRLSATGFDMTLAFELVGAMEGDQDVDIADYIDARPEKFETEIERVAMVNGTSADEITALLGAFVGISDLLTDAETAAAARE